MNKVFRMGIFFTLLVGVFTGCDSSPSSNDKEFTIYTSIYPIQYVVEQIAGDLAYVESVYPPGVDVHTYEPTSKEITNLANGDAFIYLGAGMEGFAETAADALRSQDVLFIEIGKHEELFSKGHVDGEHSHSDVDPHIWLDPLRLIEVAEIVKDELIGLNQDHEEIFEENFNLLKEDLIALDETYKETLQAKTNKTIIVTHAAYGYWEERYGVEQIGISGLSSGDEPSQKDLTKIADLAKEKQLRYVIFEQNGSDRVSTIIQEYIGAEALQIHNLEVLTDQDIKNNQDYITLMEQNLEVLDTATN